MAIKEGLKAPAFSLQGSDGKLHTLKEYAGKTLIIYFYPRDNTPGCTKEACGFSENYRALQRSKIALLGVSRDSLESHETFIKKFNLPFVLLSDPEHKMMKSYGAWGKKLMYGKSVEGTIRSTVVIGPDGKVLRHWAKVRDAAKHPQEVLEFIESSAQ